MAFRQGYGTTCHNLDPANVVRDFSSAETAGIDRHLLKRISSRMSCTTSY
jgi:hypothetical protein